MNDKELADRVVALGVGGENVGNYWIDPDDDALGWLDAKEFVRDWRVAGALMEKCQATFIEGISGTEKGVDVWGARADHGYGRRSRNWYEDVSPSRVIIWACVEALDE